MKMRLEEVAETRAEAWRGGKRVATLEWGDKWRQPFVHPVWTPRSPEPVTVFAPSDHPWHRGLWWSWKYVNGVNFWDGSEQHPSHAGFGSTLVTSHRAASKGDDVRIEQDLELRHDASGEVVAREERILTLRPSLSGVEEGEDFEAWCLDWDATWSAEHGLEFSTTPFPEKSWGGYGRLNFRPARALQWKEEVANSQGQAGAQAIHGERARWACFRGGLDGNPEALPWQPFKAGAAILAHPSNPDATQFFYSHGFAQDEQFFGVLKTAPMMHGPLQFGVGENLRLRYRVALFDGAGEMPREKLDAAWRAFAST